MSNWIQARPANGYLLHAVKSGAASQISSQERSSTRSRALVYATAACGVRGTSGMGAGGMWLDLPMPMPFRIDPVWGAPLGSCQRCARIVQKEADRG